MTGLTNLLARDTLETLITTYPYLGLLLVVGSDDGTGFTEVSGGSYQRLATASGDWEAATGTSPSYVQNAVQLNFVTPTVDWGTVIGVGLFDSPTSGNMGAWDFLGSGVWMPCTISSASPGIITAKAHGFSVADLVRYTTEYGGTSPTFSQSNFTGPLAVAHAATDTFDVTNSSTQVNTSSTGNGMVRKVVSQAVASGTFPLFQVGSLVIRVA